MQKKTIKRLFSGASIEKILCFLRIILVMLWLTVLKDTDSYFICYLLVAVVSCTVRHSGMKVSAPKRYLAVTSCIFAVLIWCANYPLFSFVADSNGKISLTVIFTSIKNSLICLAGGVTVAIPILEWCWTHCQSMNIRNIEMCSKSETRKVFGTTLCILLPIYLINLYFVEYPGTLTPDPFAQIREMISGQYSNFNSFYHTMLFQGLLSLGYRLFGNANAAVATFCTFQVLLVCFSFAYCISSLARAGIPRSFLIFVFLFYAFMPYHMEFSVTIWKDTILAIGCLLVCTSLFRFIRGFGNTFMNSCVFTLGCILFCLARNIGVYACMITFLFGLIFLRKHHTLLILMGSVVLLCWFLNGPVLSALGVAESDYVEFICLPLQQICRVITNGRQLSPEETALLSRILDLQQVPSVYMSDFADPIKKMFRSMDQAWFEENVSEYIKLWIRLGWRYPLDYAAAWIDQTKGYWNGGYAQYLYSRYMMSNSYGIFKAMEGNPVYYLYSLWYRIYDELMIFIPLHSIGLYTWALGLFTAIQASKKHPEWILSVPALTILLGLIAGAPVCLEFRYAYPILTCFPLILAAFLFPGQAHIPTRNRPTVH